MSYKTVVTFKQKKTPERRERLVVHPTGAIEHEVLGKDAVGDPRWEAVVIEDSDDLILVVLGRAIHQTKGEGHVDIGAV